MKSIAKFFIDNGKLTVVLSLGVLVFGYIGLSKMNAESFPSVSLATATIITSYDGATAKDIETKITKPLEDEIRSVSGLKDVKSISQPGLSTIVVRVDMDDSKVIVKEAMADIQRAVDRTTGLPADLKDPPKFTELKSEEFPVMEMALIGSNKDRKRDLLADYLKEELEDLKSIKNVRTVGYAERAFQIELDLKKMKTLHISISEVLQKISARNTNTPGGELRQSTTQQLIRIEGKINNSEELENIVLRANFSGKTVYLKDIANVRDDAEEITTLTRFNGEESTLLIVNKKAGADTLKMVDNIEKKLTRFKKRNPDYSISIYNNEGEKVSNRVNILVNNALSGLGLVILFLFIFLPGKIGLMASFSLPLAVLGTLGLMPSFGMNIDTITVLALVIALGMMVDNSVVISENFTRLRREGISPKEAALQSIKTLWLPITATAFTTIAAFLPMLVTKGVMGEFIKWIPVVVSLSLLGSLVESFFFLPARLTWAGGSFKPEKSKKNGDWFSKFEKWFEKTMSFFIRIRYVMAVIFSGIIIFSLFMMTKANKFILFPADQTEAYLARIEMPKGTRLTQTNKVIGDISKQIKDSLGKNAPHIVGRAGVATMGPGDPKAQEGNNVGMIIVYVSDHYKYNVSHTKVLSQLRTIKHPDIKRIGFEALVNGPPVGNPIEATFRSNDEKELNGLLSQIHTELSKTPGVLDLKVNDVFGDDEIFVKIDYVKAQRLGLDMNGIGPSIRTAISGRRLTNVTLNNKEVDLIVRFKEDQRKNLEDLDNILINNMRGDLIPLSQFASFERKTGSPHIKRFDFKRAKTLTGEVNEDIITSHKANLKLVDIFNRLHNDFPGVTLVFGGAEESTKESMESLFQALILSLIGIFGLLVFLFKSYLRPLIIMTTIPLGLLGFSVAFYFHQRPISFLALIGIIGLGGIIVNSGIVLISFIDQMREEGNLSLQTILAKASGMRLRAVVVTSLTTISGLLPTAYGIGGSDAILIPMTLAMAWGLTSGTLLTLIWVPCAYAILEDFNKIPEKIMNWRKKGGESAPPLGNDPQVFKV